MDEPRELQTLGNAEPLDMDSEASRVEAWRLRELLRAGYPLALAERIASSSTDLHQAVELLANVLAKGCTPELAADILL